MGSTQRVSTLDGQANTQGERAAGLWLCLAALAGWTERGMVGATRTLDGFRGEVIVTAEPTVWYQPGTGRISQAIGGHPSRAEEKK